MTDSHRRGTWFYVEVIAGVAVALTLLVTAPWHVYLPIMGAGFEGLWVAIALAGDDPATLLDALVFDGDATLDETLEALVDAVLRQVSDHAPWLGLSFAADDESRELAAELVAVEREAREGLVAFMAHQVDAGALTVNANDRNHGNRSVSTPRLQTATQSSMV